MTKLTLAHLASQIEILRDNADIQLRRIAQLQAELDSLPHAKKRRAKMLKAYLTQDKVYANTTRRDP